MAKKEFTEMTLDVLIPQYAENKSMLEDYKKICDLENKQIKEMMKEDNYVAGEYKAVKSTQQRNTMNEDKLLELMQGYNEAYEHGIIKTKEYIDLEALESVIYNGIFPQEILLEIDKCRETKEVVTLRISKVKEKK